MKKTVKKSVLFLIMLCMFLSVVPFSVSAATASMSSGTYKVGDKVSVSIKYTADQNIASVVGDLAYNSSVLQFAGISGVPAGDFSTSGSSIRFVDSAFSGTGKSGSYTVTFTAIAAGSSSLSLSIEGGNDSQSFPASASSTITVKTPVPSANANLSSISVSNATLSPAFSANTTSYTATVKYSVDKVTIKATPADSKSNVVGAGTFNVAVGDNNRTITVTSEDGTKKSYQVNVKRLTQEETATLEQQERENDPLLAVIDGVDYHITTDISDKGTFEGFSANNIPYKNGEVSVLKTEDGEYALYYLTADDQSVADWFYKDKNDEFKRLCYITVANRLYIIETPEDDFKTPDGYYETTYDLTMGSVKAFKSDDKTLKDFYVFYCYANSNRAFYSFDSKELTMQRVPNFGTNALKVDSKQKVGWLQKFDEISTVGKIILVCVFAAVVLIITLVVLIVLKFRAKAANEDLPLFTMGSSKNEFDMVNEDDDNFDF